MKYRIELMLERWLEDAEYLRQVAAKQNINHTKTKLIQTAERLGSAAGLLNYTKDEL